MEAHNGSRIDHFNVAVPDLDRSLKFYEPVLGAIGIAKLLDVPASPGQLAMKGFGVFPKPFFWLVEQGRVGTNMHLAFTVDSRAQVPDFFDAAVAAGAEVQLEPALHPEYHEDYFGAFVLDPDGISLEAVCHTA